MNNEKKIELRIERTIPASPAEVFDGWLNPKIPGNPWNAADKLLLEPRVDGFFYTSRGDETKGSPSSRPGSSASA